MAKYDRPWRTYDFRREPIEPLPGSYAEIKVSTIRELSDRLSGNSILDVGTDLGLMARYVPDDVKEFVGVDVCNLSEAEVLKPIGKPVTFYQRNIFDVDYPEWFGRFDFAISLSMMHVIVPEFHDCCRTKFPPRPPEFTLDDYFGKIKQYCHTLLFDCISWKYINLNRLLAVSTKHFGRTTTIRIGQNNDGLWYTIILAHS